MFSIHINYLIFSIDIFFLTILKIGKVIRCDDPTSRHEMGSVVQGLRIWETEVLTHVQDHCGHQLFCTTVCIADWEFFRPFPTARSLSTLFTQKPSLSLLPGPFWSFVSSSSLWQSSVSDSWPDDVSRVHASRVLIGPFRPALLVPRDALVDRDTLACLPCNLPIWVLMMVSPSYHTVSQFENCDTCPTPSDWSASWHHSGPSYWSPAAPFAGQLLFSITSRNTYQYVTYLAC